MSGLAAQRALIQRAVAGDEQAFSQLAAFHRPLALRLARALLGDEASAEDVAQELLIRLSAALPGFRGEADLKTWAYRVTLNLCRDQMRRGQSRAWREVALDDASERIATNTQGAGDAIDTARAAAAVRGAIEKLPHDQREAISLRFFTEMPYKEIARMTDTPIGTVASRVFRGLKRLGDELETRHLEVLK